MSNELRAYRHTSAGFSLALPVEWEATEEVEWCALVAAEPTETPERFAPNVVVTIEELRRGESLGVWVQRSREALHGDEGLNRLRILDTGETEVSGSPAYRTLSHYLHRSAGGVNLEQWAVARNGWGYVVSCSAGALDYDDYAEVLAEIAESLRIEGPPRLNGRAEAEDGRAENGHADDRLPENGRRTDGRPEGGRANDDPAEGRRPRDGRAEGEQP